MFLFFLALLIIAIFFAVRKNKGRQTGIEITLSSGEKILINPFHDYQQLVRHVPTIQKWQDYFLTVYVKILEKIFSDGKITQQQLLKVIERTAFTFFTQRKEFQDAKESRAFDGIEIIAGNCCNKCLAFHGTKYPFKSKSILTLPNIRCENLNQGDHCSCSYIGYWEE